MRRCPQLHDGQIDGHLSASYLFVFSQQIVRYNCVFSVVFKNQEFLSGPVVKPCLSCVKSVLSLAHAIKCVCLSLLLDFMGFTLQFQLP